MSPTAEQNIEQTPNADAGLQLLRLSLARHDKLPDALSEAELGLLQRQALRARRIEQLALQQTVPIDIEQEDLQRHTAALVEQIGEPQLDRALASVDLEPAGLLRALERELQFDHIARAVEARVEPISEAEVERFFEQHPQRFCLPERRSARHILITVNEDYAENLRDAARKRIDNLHAQLLAAPARFEQLALEHSECPTALEHGALGEVTADALFPALSEALFSLSEGEISAPLESPMGFHLLRCDAIQAPRQLLFSETRDRLREQLQNQRRNRVRQDWLNSLSAG